MTSNEYEIRSCAEMRAAEDGTLAGYAVRYNEPSALIAGAFTEIILPGTFTRSLASGNDVLALYQHDVKQVLGRTSNDTLSIREDANGLYFTLRPNEGTTLGRDVIAMVKRGDIGGMSFTFRPDKKGARFDMRGATAMRYVSEASLLEVSLVTVPAYPTTTVNARHLLDGRFNRRAKLRLEAAL